MAETYLPFCPPAGVGGPVAYQESPAVLDLLRRGMPLPAAALAERVGAGAGENRLLHGTCLESCALLAHQGIKAELVYIDPPFASGMDYARQVWLRPVPGQAAGPERRLPQTLYGDVWDTGEYLDWMYTNLLAIKGILSPTGSLYVHLDWHIGHYVKVLLDQVFGPENFQREIIWRIGWVSGFKSAGNNWVRNHDTIFYYTMGPRAPFHKAYLPYPAGYVRRDGKPPRGKGIPLEDTWNCSQADRLDSIQIKSFSGEKAGYATQKPQALLERIIAASSGPGDLVCDLFGGSGVTAAAAHRLGRRFIHGDVAFSSIQTARDRLLAQGAAFDILELGEDRPQGADHRALYRREGDRVILEQFHSRPVEELAAGRGKGAPIPLHPSGLDALELLSLDCTAAWGPWHADREVKIDRHGLAIRDGQPTRSRWDGTITGPGRPLRLKLRDILGGESVWALE